MNRTAEFRSSRQARLPLERTTDMSQYTTGFVGMELHGGLNRKPGEYHVCGTDFQTKEPLEWSVPFSIHSEQTGLSSKCCHDSSASIDSIGDFYLSLSRKKRQEESLIDMDDDLTSKLDTVLHYRVQSLGEGRILVTFLLLGSPPPFVIENRTLHTFAFAQKGIGVLPVDDSWYSTNSCVLQSLAVPCQR